MGRAQPRRQGCRTDPRRKIPNLSPATLFIDFNLQQITRWNREHPGQLNPQTFATYAATTPSDAELTGDFPFHISPFARVRSGSVDRWKARFAFAAAPGDAAYCPLCGSSSFGVTWDPKNPFHAVTSCCRRDLYGRDQAAPPGYDLKPNTTVPFTHLDGKTYQIPCALFKDTMGVVWELFIPTLFDHKHWLDAGHQAQRFMNYYSQTADPLYAYKLAVLLDRVADTYYALPPSSYNELATGKDGKAAHPRRVGVRRAPPTCSRPPRSVSGAAAPRTPTSAGST